MLKPKLVSIGTADNPRFQVPGIPVYIRRVPMSQKWQIRIYLTDLKRDVQFSAKTADLDKAYDIAMNRYYDCCGKIQRGEPIFEVLFKEVTAKWLVEWLQKEQIKLQVSSHMAHAYKSSCKGLLNYFGEHGINKIDSNVCEEYIITLIESEMSKVNIERRRYTFNKIMEWAKEKKYFTGNIIPQIIVPKNYKDAENRTPFETGEMDHLIAKSIEWSHLATNDGDDVWVYRRALTFLIRFMWATGCRTNDIIYLKWKYIKYDDKRATWKGVVGNSLDSFIAISMRGKMREGKNKTKCRTSTAPMSLMPHLEAYKAFAHAFGNGQDDLVFPTAPRSSLKYDRMFKEFTEWCGMRNDANGKPRTLYSIRPTYITEQLRLNKDTYKVAKQVGNTVQTIEKSYSHLLGRDLADELYD